MFVYEQFVDNYRSEQDGIAASDPRPKSRLANEIAQKIEVRSLLISAVEGKLSGAYFALRPGLRDP